MQNIVEDDKEATIFTVNPYLQGGIKMSMMDFFGCEQIKIFKVTLISGLIFL